MSDGSGASLETLARGLARRMAQVRSAEVRLSAFAWKEGAGKEAGTWSAAAADEAAAWVLRVLHVASEADSHRALRAIAGQGDVTVTSLAEALGCGSVDAADRVSALAQAGLVARDLESDRVGLTELGEGVLALVDEVTGLLGAEHPGAGERT